MKVSFGSIVDADCEDEAEDIAYNMFKEDMRYPVADTFYDDLNVKCMS